MRAETGQGDADGLWRVDHGFVTVTWTNHVDLTTHKYRTVSYKVIGITEMNMNFQLRDVTGMPIEFRRWMPKDGEKHHDPIKLLLFSHCPARGAV